MFQSARFDNEDATSLCSVDYRGFTWTFPCRVEGGAVILEASGDEADAMRAFLAAGNEPSAYTPPPLTEADFSFAIQALVDATAQARGYDSGTSCAGYVSSTVPAWAAEAAAFIAWRDAVWSYAFEQLALVQSGGREAPSVAGLLSELPSIVWP